MHFFTYLRLYKKYKLKIRSKFERDKTKLYLSEPYTYMYSLYIEGCISISNIMKALNHGVAIKLRPNREISDTTTGSQAAP